MVVDREKLEQRWKSLATDGTRVPGVNPGKNPLKTPPEWFDRERFFRAQKMAKKYFLSLNIAHFIGNILLVHLPDVLAPVIATKNSSTPFAVFMRILSTTIHILSWYEDDPFDETTKTHQSLLTVRRNCHLAVTRLMNQKYPRKQRLWLSQYDMVMTQWSLIGPVGVFPKQCAFYGTTDEEFEEYIYFWKVIGHCVGIQDRFNVCLDQYDESIEFLRICYERGYKVHLDEQSHPVKVGMQLTEGVFLALNSITPRFIVCYESFMKYWYDTLETRHPIRLNTLELKLYHKMAILVFDHLLRIRLFYVLFSMLFFFLLRKLFTKIKLVKQYCDQHYGHIEYQLDSDYFDRFDEAMENQQQQQNLEDDDEFEEISHNQTERSNFENETNGGQCYQIDNYFYRPNVQLECQ